MGNAAVNGTGRRRAWGDLGSDRAVAVLWRCEASRHGWRHLRDHITDTLVLIGLKVWRGCGAETEWFWGKGVAVRSKKLWVVWQVIG